jgi:hypothetical protein
MGWFARWRLNRAARQYAQRLPRRLRAGWGSSKTYTRGQIDTSVRALRLDARYVYIAYAVFLTPDELAGLESVFVTFSASEARDAFDRWRPWAATWHVSDDYGIGAAGAGGDYGGGGHHGAEGGGGHH